MSKTASFRCVNEGKLVCLIEDDKGGLLFGSGVTKLNGMQGVAWVMDHGVTRSYPPEAGYFDNFITRHSRTMLKEV